MKMLVTDEAHLIKILKARIKLEPYYPAEYFYIRICTVFKRYAQTDYIPLHLEWGCLSFSEVERILITNPEEGDGTPIERCQSVLNLLTEAFKNKTLFFDNDELVEFMTKQELA